MLTLTIYLLCALVSIAVAVLMLRGYRRSHSRLVFWVGVAFTFLAVSNVLLVVDLVSATDLSRVRPALIAIGLGLLIYGLIWEQNK
jgi:hypothetical protein